MEPGPWESKRSALSLSIIYKVHSAFSEISLSKLFCGKAKDFYSAFRSVNFILSLSHFENDLGDFVELYQSLIYTLYLSLDKLLHSYSFLRLGMRTEGSRGINSRMISYLNHTRCFLVFLFYHLFILFVCPVFITSLYIRRILDLQREEVIFLIGQYNRWHKPSCAVTAGISLPYSCWMFPWFILCNSILNAQNYVPYMQSLIWTILCSSKSLAPLTF